MIVSKPETRSGGTACMGSHRTSFTPPVSRRTRRVTLHPCDSSEDTRAEPISPEAPLMRMRSNADNVADFEADRLAARRVLGRPALSALTNQYLPAYTAGLKRPAPPKNADIIRAKETGHRTLIVLLPSGRH